MEEFGKLEERVVLVGVQTDDHDNVEESLDELKELASTAGAVTVGRIIQNRESVHPGTYIGKGKIEEVRALVYAMDATGIICDDELSPAQLNNLERELDCKVMDRTLLILDIFAARAITSEGKIQVELAQLRYRSARLVGLRGISFPSGRWNRNQRSGREKAGDRPSSYPYKDLCFEAGIIPGGETQGTDPFQPGQRQYEDCCDRRIYKCGKIYAAEHTDRLRGFIRG